MENQVQNIQVDAGNNLVTVAVNPEVYPLDVIYGASFVYVDRAFVMLDRNDESHVLISLKAKTDADEEALQSLGGEFANELLTQAFRESIAKKTLKIRELIINRALYSTLDSGGAADDMDFDEEDDLEFLDDPLGIAVPWEEKFEGEDDASAESKDEDEAPAEVEAEKKDD